MTTPPANPETPPAETPPVEPSPANPPAGDPPAAARPEGIPDELWGDSGFNADVFTSRYRALPEDLPSAADAYALPTDIEGFDAEAAMNSPLFTTLRAHAHAVGMGQGDFNKLVADYAKAETEANDAYYDSERAKMGQNAEQRITSVSTFLDSKLPPEEARALKGIATNALVLQGLERLMGGQAPAPREGDPPPTGEKSEAEIRALMASPAYSGKPKERDPAVIKEVDDWYKKRYAEPGA